MTEIVLVLDNVRSAFNVGSLLRTAEGMGLSRVITIGMTPHPRQKRETRLPHVVSKAEMLLAKTALGAERTLIINHFSEFKTAADFLLNQGFRLVGLEVAASASDIRSYQPRAPRLALIVGHERNGLTPEAIAMSNELVAIPMVGKKESLNVAVAAGIALYHLTGNKDVA